MFYNLNPLSSVNIAEDTRNAKTTVTTPVTSTASVALAANTNRANYSIYNISSTTVFVREGSVVTSTLYDFAIPPGFYWKEDFSGAPKYLGAISAITASGTASLQVSEGTLI